MCTDTPCLNGGKCMHGQKCVCAGTFHGDQCAIEGKHIVFVNFTN